ncbi:MAG: S1/P1 nuclease [Rikenellaceae bacterium]
MRRITFLLLTLLMAVNNSYGWGKRGHDVVCYIAECNLSPEALENVTDLLDGYSMVYFSSWLDSASNTSEYKHTKTWHYMNMEKRDRVATMERVKEGDVLSASEISIATLRNNKSSREEKSVALKMLIHLIGDMHQPMHIGRLGDQGGNKIPVVYFVDSTTLHSAWDYNIVMGAHEWSYTEWQQQLDRLSDEQEAIVVSGDMADWVEQTQGVAQEIYRDTPAETRIFYDYMVKYTPIVEQQLLYAGVRLAHILNDIYEK